MTTISIQPTSQTTATTRRFAHTTLASQDLPQFLKDNVISIHIDFPFENAQSRNHHAFINTCVHQIVRLSVRDECSWRFSNLEATKSKCSPNFCFLPIFFNKIAKFVFIVFRNFYKLTKAEQTMSKKRHRPTSRIIHPSLSDTHT